MNATCTQSGDQEYLKGGVNMFTIADAARKVTDNANVSYDNTLTVLTSYVWVLGVDTGTHLGGQAPDVEISQDIFERICDVFYAALEDV
jgi:hypothetical protein